MKTFNLALILPLFLFSLSFHLVAAQKQVVQTLNQIITIRMQQKMMAPALLGEINLLQAILLTLTTAQPLLVQRTH